VRHEWHGILHCLETCDWLNLMTRLIHSPSQIVNPLQRRRFIGYGTGASGGSTPFAGALDAYTANLFVALLPFRGFTGYEGYAMKIRDSSGGAETDIAYLANGDLAAVSTVGSPYIRTFYNQTGSNDFGQATTAQQPGFTASGINSLPAMTFTGSNDQFLKSVSSMNWTNGMTLYVVLDFGVDGAWQTFWSVDGSTDTRLRKTTADILQFTSAGNNATGATPLGTSPMIITASTSKKAWLNNVLEIDEAADSASTGQYCTGLDGLGSWPMNGQISAILAYNAVHDDTTRGAIQAILAARFSIALAGQWLWETGYAMQWETGFNLLTN